MPAIDLLLLNEREHESLGTVDGPLVVVKHGAGGAAAHTAGGVVRAGRAPVEVVDTTGAGDSFDAGFLAAWLAGEPLERALALGNACGALSTRALGGVTAQPTMAEARAAAVIVCVAANPSIDRLFGVDRLTRGGIHRPAEFAQVAGGKGLNVARAASALGAEVRAVALLGGHAGRWIAEQCEREGVELAAAWAQAETRSSLSVAGADQGLTEFYEHGAAVTLEEWSGFAELAAQHLPRAGWATISGSLPPGAPADGYVPLIRVTRSAFDSREQGIAARPALVKVNAAEAAQLTGKSDALDAARTLHEAGGGAAIVTRGRDGAVMVAPDGRARWPAPPTPRAATRWEAATRSWRAWWWHSTAELAGTMRCARRSARARPTPSSPARVGSTPSEHGRSRTRYASRPSADRPRNRHGRETSWDFPADPLIATIRSRTITAGAASAHDGRVGL